MDTTLSHTGILGLKWVKIAALFIGGSFFIGYTMSFLDYDGGIELFYFPARLAYHTCLDPSLLVDEMLVDSVRDEIIVYMVSLFGAVAGLPTIGALIIQPLCLGVGLPVVLEYGEAGVIGFYIVCGALDLSSLCLVSAFSLSTFTQLVGVFRGRKLRVKTWQIDLLLYSIPLLLLSSVIRLVAARWTV